MIHDASRLRYGLSQKGEQSREICCGCEFLILVSQCVFDGVEYDSCLGTCQCLLSSSPARWSDDSLLSGSVTWAT